MGFKLGFIIPGPAGTGGGSTFAISGGNSTWDEGSYRYIKFTTSGTLVITGSGIIDIQLTGGGGGGGGAIEFTAGGAWWELGGGGDTYAVGGGGSGSQTLFVNNQSVSDGTFDVIVGAGGKGGEGSSDGQSGEKSSISFQPAIEALGGKGGGCTGDGQSGFNGSGGGFYLQGGMAMQTQGGYGDNYWGGGGMNDGGGGAGDKQNGATPGNGGGGTTGFDNKTYSSGGGGGKYSGEGVNVGGEYSGGDGAGVSMKDKEPTYTKPGNGMDEFGGGGGGGNPKFLYGGDGGIGAVIIRYQF